MPFHFTGALAAAIGAALAFTVTANAWNDADDVAIDRKIHPERPIPTGRISVTQARRFGGGAAIVAMGLSFFANEFLGILSILVVVLMLSYSRFLRRDPFAGTMAVGALASLPFLYGGAAVGDGFRGAQLVVLACSLHWAREVAKDIDDVPGDAGARRTFPIVAGLPAAKVGVEALLVIFVWSVNTMFVPNIWLVIAGIPFVAILVMASVDMWRGGAGVSKMLKTAMLVGMVSILCLNETGQLAFRLSREP